MPRMRVGVACVAGLAGGTELFMTSPNNRLPNVLTLLGGGVILLIGVSVGRGGSVLAGAAALTGGVS
ncbi:hypothetical protein MUBE_10870 [Mycobacterium uberis]|uniref:Uncharacterized protein n=1 Tax=Mycobacterium uberis TaxID=2162698 RepID=A0A3E1HFD8_9MYCO|nr:hypothetical protein MUBE_10870 [Mycobacterium uberis]